MKKVENYVELAEIAKQVAVTVEEKYRVACFETVLRYLLDSGFGGDSKNKSSVQRRTDSVIKESSSSNGLNLDSDEDALKYLLEKDLDVSEFSTVFQKGKSIEKIFAIMYIAERQGKVPELSPPMVTELYEKKFGQGRLFAENVSTGLQSQLSRFLVTRRSGKTGRTYYYKLTDSGKSWLENRTKELR